MIVGKKDKLTYMTTHACMALTQMVVKLGKLVDVMIQKSKIRTWQAVLAYNDFPIHFCYEYKLLIRRGEREGELVLISKIRSLGSNEKSFTTIFGLNHHIPW